MGWGCFFFLIFLFSNIPLFRYLVFHFMSRVYRRTGGQCLIDYLDYRQHPSRDYATAYLDNCGRQGTTFATLVHPRHRLTAICAKPLCCALQQSFYSFVQWPFIWLLGPALSHSFTTNEAQAVYASTFTLCRFRCFTIDPCDIHIPFTSFSLAWLSFATPALGLTSVSPW
jgi:hypothetical protein